MKTSDTVSEIKSQFSGDLKELAGKITNNDRLQVCINLDIAPATFERYTSGRVEELRRLELAEQIGTEIKKIIAAKEPVSA